MDYSPLNPLVWGLFFLFILLVVGVERCFRRKHPDYPGRRR
jgi:hypothetical protein